jgi:CheY-like chemotaxis protein
LTQVFLNVLLNAIQAIEPGHIEDNVVEITTRVVTPGLVEVAIFDTGGGIPPDLLQRVSEPFFTTKPVGEGTGLGLPVSRNILEGYGGSLSIESELGKGTTVRVTMTVTEGEIEAPRSAPRPDAPLDVRARILLVDDDRLVVKSMRRVLRDHDLSTVDSGREALELLRNDPGYDLVLCDLMMPDVSGMDVYEALIAEQPGLAERIVFMSGGAFTQRAQQFLAGVSNTFIEKPFDKGELDDLVRQAMQRGT